MRVSSFCCRICFPKANLTQTLAEMHNTWFFSEVRVTGNRLASLQNERLIKIVQHSCPLTRKKPKGLMGILVDNQPKTTSDNQVVADIFGECRCYPNIVTQDKSVPTLETDPSIVKPTVETKLTTSKVKQLVKVKPSVKTKPVEVKQTVKVKPANVKRPFKVKNSVKVKEATRKQAVKRKRMSEDPSVEIKIHLNKRQNWKSFGLE